MKEGIKVAVVGATGAVGKELLSILENRKFPIKELVLFASNRSDGKVISWNGKAHRCKSLQKGCFDGVDIAFFDASDAVSKEWVPQAAESGAWVVDNSAAFRMDEDILLIVPEVNGDLLEARLKSKSNDQFTARERIITGPNCVAAPLVVALNPIQKKWGLKRVVVSTYQSTSGAGSSAMEELSIQTVAMFNQRSITPKFFPHQIAFNCIPHIGSFKEDGSTGEEQKIIVEAKKMLRAPQLRISATSVRVPTFSCHGESVNIECERAFGEVDEVRNALQQQQGLILQDDPKKNIYPMGFTAEGDPVEKATGKDAVYVGRVRRDASVDSGINLWLVSDNLRKGAALNAVQIGEALLKALH